MIPVYRRRGVLGLLAGVAAAPALAGTPAAAGDPLARICARAGRHRDLAALGRAWCARNPGVTRAAWLQALAADLAPDPDGRSADETRLIRSLRARAVDDFRERRIVALDGWRISLTEARICAAGVTTERPAA